MKNSTIKVKPEVLTSFSRYDAAGLDGPLLVGRLLWRSNEAFVFPYRDGQLEPTPGQVAELLGEGIDRIHGEKSVSSLFV